MKNIIKADNEFYNEIKSALKEKDIENTYRRLFKLALPNAKIKSFCNTDGVLISPYPENYKYNKKTAKIEVRKLVALLEFKYGYDFNNSYDDVISGLMQSLYYLKNCKQIEAKYHVPKVIFVGDESAGFIISTDVLMKYINDETINWNIAPSSSMVKNPKLFKRLKSDSKIVPYLFKIDKNFKFSDIILKMFKFDEGNFNKMLITVDNIDIVFDKFKNNVLKNQGLKTHQEVSIFMNMLLDTDNDNNYSRKHKSILVTSVEGIDNVKINLMHYNAFRKEYKFKYTLKEKTEMVKMCDRLIEDENRRREGAFFTPTIWVNEAHKMIESELGKNWKDEYVVWDCCSGTGNLTRDKEFKELYSSTLLQEEIDIFNGNNTNQKTTFFKYDFLGLNIETHEKLTGEKFDEPVFAMDNNSYAKYEDDKIALPKGLYKALKHNKKIVFFMNPPYGTAKNMTTKKGDEGNKEKIAYSIINKEMKRNGMGAASQQLYAQFLYKILVYVKRYGLTDVVIATYSPTLFMSGPAFKLFRKKFLNKFEYKNGMLFQADHFSDVSGNWGIAFTIWNIGKTENRNEFKFSLKDIVDDKIETIGEKTIYNLDNSRKASDWVREEIKELKTHKDCVQLSSALNPNLDGNLRGSDINNSIGYFHNNANNVYYNPSFVGLYSSVFSGANGLPIIPENYKKCIALFTARKTIGKNWINDKDEYSKPDIKHPKYNQWNNDAIVYALFHSSSQQSSMRNIQYKCKSWDIKNEFFWISKDTMLKLGEKYYFDELQSDIDMHGNEERFIYDKLQITRLSPDAQELLNKATELVELSFKHRKELHKEHPEYNLQCWDAGWYQVKKILNKYPEFKEFNAMYKSFEDRMREGIYEFGFLRR